MSFGLFFIPYTPNKGFVLETKQCVYYHRGNEVGNVDWGQHGDTRRQCESMWGQFMDVMETQRRKETQNEECLYFSMVPII